MRDHGEARVRRPHEDAAGLPDAPQKLASEGTSPKATRRARKRVRECESINGEHGLWQRTVNGNTKIVLRHLVDPVPGYSLEVNFCPADGSEERRWMFLLQPSEALGISEAISGSMYLVAFGVPKVPKAAVTD